MWPGNTADVTTLIPVIDRLRRRFDIARVCVVADRGMISAETVAELEARRLLYILGVRERTDKLVRQLVLDDPAPFVPLAVKKRGKESDYQAKTVTLAGRRYIVCRNHQEAEKDAADRAAIVAALERQLAKGDKALVSNTGFRRYLKTISGEHFAIDPDKIEQERKFDGVFVLRTNTDLNPLEAMQCYKQLWTVEQTFRTAKHLFSTRPIFHKLDETIRGHVFCSFLALVLKTTLEDCIAALARSGSWPEIIADLDSDEMPGTLTAHPDAAICARSQRSSAAKGQAARKMHRISSVRQKEGRGSTESRRRSTMMERKIVCDLNLVSVDFGREEELRPGNTFRISFRHTNGQPTGTIEVYQGEAEHFIVELEAVAAFIRAALVK